MAAHLVKVEWRSATMESGGQSVTMAGKIGMQLLCAYNWGFKEQVSNLKAIAVLFQ